jgi:hypothetical protein
MVEGTNGLSFDADKTFAKIFVTLTFGNSEQFKNGRPEYILGCKSSKHKLFGNPSGIETVWDLEFGQGGFMDRGRLTDKDVAGKAKEWDTVEFDAFFLPADTEVVFGEITLTINSTIKKRFTIPPQKAKRPFPDHRIIGKSVTVFAMQPVGD